MFDVYYKQPRHQTEIVNGALPGPYSPHHVRASMLLKKRL